MKMHRRIALVAALLVYGGAAVVGQDSTLASSQATAFIGTWALTMTEPEAFKGSQQTVRIWNKNGVVAASVQIGKFPPVDVTGIFKDGDMLVLTVSHKAQPPDDGKRCAHLGGHFIDAGRRHDENGPNARTESDD